MIETFPPASVMPPNDRGLTGTFQYLPFKVTEVPKNILKTYSHTKRVGNYLLGRTLGEGSFAKVKEGLHILTGEKVAVKIIDKKKAKEDAYVRKNLRREGKLLQMVRHNNVMQLHEIMETENCYYLVTELCEGGDLMDYICNKRHLDERETRKFIRQIISAVDYIHKTGIIHRDLKIENLLLDENKDIKIIDFGLSNSVHVSNSNTGGQMHEYCVTQCGSPAYAAPELLSNRKYGPKVDIWSIGVNMYAMLTGNLPFTVEPFNIKALHTKMLNADINPFPAHLSPGCRELLKKLLTPDPDLRISLSEAMQHPWINEGKGRAMEPAPFPNKLKPEDMDQNILRHMSQNMDYKISEIIRMSSNNTPSNICATYRLLHKRLSRYNAEMRVKGRVAASDARVLADNKPTVFTKIREEENPKITAGEIIDLIPINHTDGNSKPVHTNATQLVRNNTSRPVGNTTTQAAWNAGNQVPELNNNETVPKNETELPSVPPTSATNHNTYNDQMTPRMNAYRLSKRKTERKGLNSNSDGTGIVLDTFNRKQTRSRQENTVEEKLFTLSNEGVKRREDAVPKSRNNAHPGRENRMVAMATPHVVLHKRIAEVAEELNSSDRDNANKSLSQESPQHDLPEIVRRYSCLKENVDNDDIIGDSADKENNNNNNNNNNDSTDNSCYITECQNAIRRKNIETPNKNRKLKSGLAKTTDLTRYGSPSHGSLNRAKTLHLDCSANLKYATDNHTRVSVKSLSKQGRKVVDLALYDRYARKSIKTLPSVFNSQKIFNGKRTSEAAFGYPTKRLPVSTDISPIKRSNRKAEEEKRDLHRQDHSESRDSGIVCNIGAEKSTKFTSLKRSPIENSLPTKPSNGNAVNTQSANLKDSGRGTLTNADHSEESVTTKDSKIMLPSISPPLTHR